MADRSPVAAAADELGRGLAAAARLISRPDVTATSSRAATPAGSAPPWNTAAAAAVLDAHEGIRRAEASLRRQVTGHPGDRRGGSTVNTYRALDAVVRLAEAIPDEDRVRIARILRRWDAATRRLTAVDQLARWIPIRAQAGGRPPACPYCRTFSLRVAERSGVIVCFYPGCADADGERPYGRLDMSRITGDPVIAWNDGLTEGATP
jgi:hypothetical protein